MNVDSVGHGRAHIQQALHRLEKGVRQAVREELKQSDLSRTERREVRTEVQTFRAELSDVFHEAGNGGDFDYGVFLEGLRETVIALTDRLRAFNDARLPELLPQEPPESDPEEAAGAIVTTPGDGASASSGQPEAVVQPLLVDVTA